MVEQGRHRHRNTQPGRQALHQFHAENGIDAQRGEILLVIQAVERLTQGFRQRPPHRGPRHRQRRLWRVRHIGY